jgi:hypothetical protein
MYQARGEEKLGRKHNVIMVKAPNEVWSIVVQRIDDLFEYD